MRRGATLLELLIVLCLLALVAGWAVPHATSWRDRVATEEAAQVIAGAHARARLAAAAHGQPVVLDLSHHQLRLRVARGADTLDTWSAPGPASLGVEATSLPRRVVVGPNGLPIGLANHTMLLQRGAARRTVVVSRLGRVRIERGG